ncbi:MAG: HAD family hydrolase [Spirochaetia bacterium]|nr:HAD family hydrolase [Spirochaetia bacterium]
MKSTIHIVSFDFWNTLYYNTASLKYERAARIGSFLEKLFSKAVSEQQILQSMDTAWKIWDEVWNQEHRTLTVDSWLDIVLDQLGVKLSSGDLYVLCTTLQKAVFTGLSVPVPGMLETVHQSAGRYRLSVISDTGVASGAYLSRLMEKDGITSAEIPCRIYSDETGISKPHPGMFRKVLDYYDCRPDQMVHIGDLKKTDIAGAAALGIHTIRFAGIHDDTSAAVTAEAEVVIYEYKDLLSILNSI